MQSFRLIFFLLFSYTIFAQTNQFELGLQEYDLLNLEDAIKHFNAAETELLVKTPNLSIKQHLAKILFYQATTYFLLNNLNTAKEKVAKLLYYQDSCVVEYLKLPSILYEYCLKLQTEKSKKLEEDFAKNILNLPEQISKKNLETINLQNAKKKQTLQKTGQWLMISSALPFSLGIGFSVGAFMARQDFTQHPNLATQITWRNYSILTDVNLACGVVLVALGLTLSLLNLDYN